MNHVFLVVILVRKLILTACITYLMASMQSKSKLDGTKSAVKDGVNVWEGNLGGVRPIC